MQGLLNRKAWVGPSGLALVCMLLQACSTYRPLDRGADVPWAKSRQLASADALSIRPAAGPAAAQLPLGAHQHRVAKGDRLSTLARAYGVAVHALAEANALQPPYVIYVGQVLQIPAVGEVERPVPIAAAGAARGLPPISTVGGRYTVRPGDTLSSLAHRLDVSMAELAALNELEPPYHLKVGQRLQLAPPSVAASRGEASRSEDALRHDPPPLSGEGFLWPVNGKLIAGFGKSKDGQRRAGIDIAARKGTPVVAAEDGVVIYAGDGIRSYGKLILVRHDEEYITTYAHNSVLLVEPGQTVRRGELIARVGDTGDVSQSLLHFELRRGRKPIDPERMLVGSPTEVASSQ